MTTPRPSPTPPDASPARPRHLLRLVLGLVAAAAMVLGAACDIPPASAATSFTFTGGGWGHGVGMSQWGARGMAANGSSYDQILTHYYSGTAVVTRPVSNDLRVLATERQSTITLTAVTGTTTINGVGLLPAGTSATLTRSGSNIRITGGLNATVADPLTIRYQDAGTLKVSPPGYTYRYGTLVVRIDGAGGLRAIVHDLTMQRYLYGLGEMSSSWPTEALKAQATASRTFAQKRRDARGSADFDLYGSIYHQAYTGTRFEEARWVDAVNATANRFITYNGTLIDAYYSASSGGHTENSEIVWVATIPYLKGRPDPFDNTGGNPNGAWSRTYSGAQLGSWFGLGTVTSVQILGNTGVSGRVDKATIRLTGTGGRKDVNGATFRSTVNSKSPSSQIPSTKFVVK